MIHSLNLHRSNQKDIIGAGIHLARWKFGESLIIAGFMGAIGAANMRDASKQVVAWKGFVCLMAEESAALNLIA